MMSNPKIRLLIFDSASKLQGMCLVRGISTPCIVFVEVNLSVACQLGHQNFGLLNCSIAIAHLLDVSLAMRALACLKSFDPIHAFSLMPLFSSSYSRNYFLNCMQDTYTFGLRSIKRYPALALTRLSRYSFFSEDPE